MIVRRRIHPQGFAKFFLRPIEILLLEKDCPQQMMRNIGIRIERDGNFQFVHSLLRLIVEQRAWPRMRCSLAPAGF